MNPSPAQIKPNQTPLTRDMMGKRQGSQVVIASEEWRIEQPGNIGGRAHGAITLVCCDAGENDEDFGAWCVQVLSPHLSEARGFRFACKMLSSTGPAKHVLVADFASRSDILAAQQTVRDGAWEGRVREYQQHLAGSPWHAKRIWPAM